MKKKLTRMTACFMAALIAVNLVAIPKAKAVVTEAAIGTAALASYMTATGVPLTVVSGGAGAASAGVTALASGYAAATGTTSAAVMGSIAAGTTITTGGLIIIGVAAAALLAGIVAWAIDEYGIEEGQPSVEVYSGEGWMIDGEIYYPVYYQNWRQSSRVFELNRVYQTGDGTFMVASDSDGVRFYNNNDVLIEWTEVDLSSAVGFVLPTYNLNSVASSMYFIAYEGDFPSACSIVYQSGVLGFANFFGDLRNDSIAVYLDENYEAPPEVADQQTMVINTGLTAEDEQGIVDAVLEGIAASTFAPTYTIEVDSSGDSGEDSGDDSVTDPDADTQIGLLERIANGIDGLAEEIKDGIASIFAPDAALMTEISSTFSDKFGFVSTLYTLGTDLLSLEADASPPVIYINLDDAEGQFYYGGQVVALDLSWYSRYKEDVDRIMSGFLWLGFLWLVFKRASAIIQGAEMVNDYSADLDRGFRFRGERNGKHF